MKKKELKSESFLSIAVKALSPDFTHKSNDWSPGLLGILHGMFIQPFPGPKKLLMPAYFAIGLGAIPLVLAYYIGKEQVKVWSKDYVEPLKMEHLFFDTYNNNGDMAQFTDKLSKFPYKGNKNTYMMMIEYLSRKPTELDDTHKFIQSIILNAKVKPEGFNDFFTDILEVLCNKNYLSDIKFILNDQGIKDHIVNNNLSYDIDKEYFLEKTKDKYNNSNRVTLDYLKILPEKSFKFNVETKTTRKLKMS